VLLGNILLKKNAQMKNVLLTILFFHATIGIVEGNRLVEVVELASLEKAKELLAKEDGFTNCWSQFDIDSRMHKTNSTKAELLAYLPTQAQSWSSKETKALQKAFETLDKSIERQGFHINFPDKIYFVKTTGEEEGGAAGYTRENYVVLKGETVLGDKKQLLELVAHELFHILSRSDAQLRTQMYQLIGFHVVGEIEYPESMSSIRITNPDAYLVQSYITVLVDGQRVDCAMILYANDDYSGGNFFKYLEVGFLKLEGDETKTVSYEDGTPIIYDPDEVSNFHEQIGRNTGYVLDPEEVLASNFAFVMLEKSGLPSQTLLHNMKRLLQAKN